VYNLVAQRLVGSAVALSVYRTSKVYNLVARRLFGSPVAEVFKVGEQSILTCSALSSAHGLKNEVYSCVKHFILLLVLKNEVYLANERRLFSILLTPSVVLLNFRFLSLETERVDLKLLMNN